MWRIAVQGLSCIVGNETNNEKKDQVMSSSRISRRAMTIGIAAIPACLGLAAQASGEPKKAMAAAPSGAHGLSHTAEVIHQEISINARRERVYKALTDTEQFRRVMLLGQAKELVTAPGAPPASISPTVGGTFTLFGGIITGQQLVLKPHESIVQAWHDSAWKSNEFSIASFALLEDGQRTKLMFDHRGFPDGAGPHLAPGWYLNYWDPLAKFLADA
jgi:activator of HSP90 ATPase